MTWFFIKEACELMAEKSERMVVYQHEPEGNDDNVHVHIYLVNTQVSTDTLKNYIKKFTRVPSDKGNKFWSFKTEYIPYGSTKPQPLDSGCITYMSKGELQPVFNKGFTQEELDMCRDRWDPTVIEKTKKTYQSKLMYVVKETHKDSKLRQNQMIDEIIKRLRLEIKNDDDVTDNQILLTIRQVVIIEQETICGRYKIRDYFDTVKAKMSSKESWLSSMRNICVRDM